MNDLLRILSALNPDIDFEKETALIDREMLDSFDLITLVTEIEDAFGVEIPPEALIAAHFNSAKALYALILELKES